MYAALVIVNCALVIVLMSKWRSRAVRLLLALWIIAASADYVLNPGNRFVLLSVIVAMVLSYDRFVGRLSFTRVAVGGAVLAVAFFAAGFLRGGSSLLDGPIDPAAVAADARLFFSINNEFQISYGSIAEIQRHIADRTLPQPPWEFLASEVLLLVPSQLLPFNKIDPTQWYTDQSDDAGFFLFGVVAQSLMGLGHLELILRGIVVGLLLALVHNHWQRRPHSLWTNLLYVWLAIMIYNSVRNTSLYLLAPILLRFLPVRLLTTVCASAFETVARRSPPMSDPAG
jgi:hypothetical protein